MRSPWATETCGRNGGAIDPVHSLGCEFRDADISRFAPDGLRVNVTRDRQSAAITIGKNDTDESQFEIGRAELPLGE